MEQDARFIAATDEHGYKVLVVVANIAAVRETVSGITIILADGTWLTGLRDITPITIDRYLTDLHKD